jgi:hypothetical protein
VSSNDEQMEFGIYPTVVSNIIFINLPDKHDFISGRIYNIHNEFMIEWTNKNEFNINVSDLTPGVYYFEIKYNTYSQRMRFIKI